MNELYKKFEDVKCGFCNKDGFVISNGRVTKCDCRKKYEERVRISDKLQKSNIVNKSSTPEEVESLLNYSLEDYRGKDAEENVRKIEKYLNFFDKTFKSINLYFHGGFGTQKTTIAKHILVSLLMEEKSVYYIQAKDLIDLIMRSDREDSIRNLIENIIKVDCLVIDEFSKDRIASFSSGYKEKVLLPFLKTRLESVRKSTIFVSNDSVDELSELGEVIQDLVSRETLVGRFEFKDKYTDYMDSIDLGSIWD